MHSASTPIVGLSDKAGEGGGLADEPPVSGRWRRGDAARPPAAERRAARARADGFAAARQGLATWP